MGIAGHLDRDETSLGRIRTRPQFGPMKHDRCEHARSSRLVDVPTVHCVTIVRRQPVSNTLRRAQLAIPVGVNADLEVASNLSRSRVDLVSWLLSSCPKSPVRRGVSASIGEGDSNDSQSGVGHRLKGTSQSDRIEQLSAGNVHR